MLTLDRVVAGYGGGDVLHGVSLECAPSTVTCVIGPNGAGKSTVLRVISGLLAPRAGEVRLGGEVLSGCSTQEILRHGVVQVPQSQALFPKMTIAENVLMGGYLLRKNRALLHARLAAVEELVPLVRERASEPAGNLSGGQRRMVEIGRCLMLEPKVVMMDEPSLGLDPRSLAAVAALIERIHLSGATVLLVEQNVRIGLGLATHGVVMEGGRVRLTGRAAEIAGHPDIGQLYLGAPTAAGSTVNTPPTKGL